MTAQRLGVATRRQFSGHEQRDDPARWCQLQRTLGERNGNIGQMCEPTSPGRRTPARIAACERLAHARRQALGAHPRRIAGHQIEAASAYDFREMGFEGEKRRRAFLAQPAPRRSELAQALSQTREL